MITTCVMLALAAGGAAVTIAKSRLFEAVRQWPRARYGVLNYHRDRLRMPSAWRLLDALLRCPYCIAHWLTLAAVLAYRPRLIRSDVQAVDLFVTWLALTAAALLVAALLCRAYEFEGER